MFKFEHIFNSLLENANVAGGTDSVFGKVDAGSTGNQFPAQNSKGYNAGNNLPYNPASMVLGAKKQKGKKNKSKVIRRSPIGL